MRLTNIKVSDYLGSFSRSWWFATIHTITTMPMVFSVGSTNQMDGSFWWNSYGMSIRVGAGVATRFSVGATNTITWIVHCSTRYTWKFQRWGKMIVWNETIPQTHLSWQKESLCVVFSQFYNEWTTNFRTRPLLSLRLIMCISDVFVSRGGCSYQFARLTLSSGVCMPVCLSVCLYV